MKISKYSHRRSRGFWIKNGKKKLYLFKTKEANHVWGFIICVFKDDKILKTFELFFKRNYHIRKVA